MCMYNKKNNFFHYQVEGGGAGFGGSKALEECPAKNAIFFTCSLSEAKIINEKCIKFEKGLKIRITEF